MSESLSRLVGEFRMRGVTLERDGQDLVIEAPAGVLTEEDRTKLKESKAGLLDYLERSVAARKRIGQAMLSAEKLFPDRFDWCRSNPEVTEAANAVDRAIVAYVEGSGPMEDLERAWRMYTRTIDTRAREEKGKTK